MATKELINPLLTLNGNVTEEHVGELEAAIAAKEKELVGLRQLHKLGLALTGKLPERKSPTRRTDGGARPDPFDVETKRREVVRFLRDGPKNGQEVMLGCRIGGPRLSEVMSARGSTRGRAATT